MQPGDLLRIRIQQAAEKRCRHERGRHGTRGAALQGCARGNAP